MHVIRSFVRPAVFAAAVAALFAGAQAAFAELPRVSPFIELDYFMFDEADDDFNEDVSALRNNVNTTFLSATGDSDDDDALGGRLGLLVKPGVAGLAVGPSIGFVRGPAYDLDVTGSGGSFVQGRVSREFNTSFVRALAEASVRMSLIGPVGLRLGGGLGWAWARTDSETNASATVLGFTGGSNGEDSRSWNGLTWEVSPAVVVDAGLIEAVVGGRYAVFPGETGGEGFPSVKGETYGVFAGIVF